MSPPKLELFRLAIDIPYFGQRKCGIRCDAQQREVFRLCNPRTILNCSRQTGKSTTAALKALHSAFFRPDATIVVTAPTMSQTREFIRKVRNFAFLAAASVRGDRFTVQLKNGARIIGIASNENTVRGYSSVALLIVDEASRVKDEVYYALLPMLAVSNGSIWLLSTPKGKRGFFYAEWASPEIEQWVKIRAKGQDCPRIPAEFLESQKRRMAERRFAQEFECAFIDIAFGVFHPDAVRNAFTDKIKPLEF